ncbi:hypothetical protein COBT_002135, partial [Conglomerata obtusa]
MLYDEHGVIIFNHVQYAYKLHKIDDETNEAYYNYSKNVFINIKYRYSKYEENYFIFLPIAGLKDKNTEDFMLNNEKIIETEARSAIDKHSHLIFSDERILIRNLVKSIMSNLKLKDDYL